jgi:asparagine synthase (glutamine-hydrolysing)
VCGFIVLVGVKEFNKETFRRSLDLLAHRGPDDSSILESNGVVFGFRRLAIQDLSAAGMQPMMRELEPPFAKEKVTVVFNGEIYNFRELKKELVAAGSKFSTGTDTEVILEAYIKWGWNSMLQRLEGMFAIVLYDSAKKTIFSARDIFGQKPFFYARLGYGAFILASEIKAMLGFLDSIELDQTSIINPIFTTGLPPRGRTMFRNVNQLNPAEEAIIALESGNLSTRRYFDPKDLVSEREYHELSRLTKNEILKRYEEVLGNSVSQHLVSDAPLGSMFSGGVDSSLITHFASKHQRIQAYNWASNKADCSEFTTDFTNKNNCDLTIVKGQDENLVSDIPKLTYHYETINKWEGTALSKLTEYATQDGIKVLLSGDGSEELFGQSHYGIFHSQMRFSAGRRGEIFRFLSKAFPSSFLATGWEDPHGLIYSHSPPFGHLTEIPLNCLYHRGHRLGEWNDCLETYQFLTDPADHLVKAYALDEIRYRIERFMIRSDRYGMMNSVEIRNPFLDKELVRLALNTPLRWLLKKNLFFRGYEKKYVIKELAVRQGISRKIAYRKKIGTPIFFGEQLDQVVRRWDFKKISELLEIDPKVLRDVATESYDPDKLRFQYGILAADLLVRIFVDSEHYSELESKIKNCIQ